MDIFVWGSLELSKMMIIEVFKDDSKHKSSNCILEYDKIYQIDIPEM